MTWECHNCGEQHDSLPEKCRSCGTAPEIVENVWRCASCGESGIGGTRTSCPSCGAEKGKDAQVAVDPSRRIEGERGRALAENAWRYCAYCKTQVPPVNDRGAVNENCPTCGGPLSESTQQAASQLVTAEEAAVYRPQAIEGEAVPAPLQSEEVQHHLSDKPLDLSASPAPPPAPPKQKPSGNVGIYVFSFLALFIFLCGYIGYEPQRVEQVQVQSKRWQHSIDVEEMSQIKGEAWASKIPKDAHDKTCALKQNGEREVFDHEEESFEDVEDRANCLEHSERQVTVDVRDGDESYTAQEQVGKSCVKSGFVTNGGVSVKKCLEWEAKFQDVTRTRPKYRKEAQTVRDCVRYGTKQERHTKKIYRKEPILEDYCGYIVDVWKQTRTLTKEGSDANPQWPETQQLSEKERLGNRQTLYGVTFKSILDAKLGSEKKKGVCEEKPCELFYEYPEWTGFTVGNIMRAVTRYNTIKRFLKEGEKL